MQIQITEYLKQSMGDEKLPQKSYRKCGDYFSDIAFPAT